MTSPQMGHWPVWGFLLDAAQRDLAALLAISVRCSGDNLAALAVPLLDAARVGRLIGSSPIDCITTWNARVFMSMPHDRSSQTRPQDLCKFKLYQYRKVCRGLRDSLGG